ncbi:hypothetical protein [Kitasatospora sp. NPDC097643]|uniref:hypothetical protein n=1 Tax=Kitasatospora sp. NPDC097643 TaxID=3157230 RepID=UPI003319C8A2
MSREGRDDGPGESPSGPEVVKLIEKLLEDERANKASAQSRGLAVISTSGTLATLLLAFAALATRSRSTFALHPDSKIPLVLAPVLFVVASVLGLIINTHLRRTVGLNYPELHKILTEKAWNAPTVKVIRLLAEDQAKILDDAHNLNAVRAKLLTWAIGVEIAGIACAAWAVISIVVHG